MMAQLLRLSDVQRLHDTRVREGELLQLRSPPMLA